MKMDSKTYGQMTQKASPPSRFVKDCLWAFFVGGAICLLGEVLRQIYLKAGYTLADAGTLTSVTLVALSAVTTALGWYQKLASKAGAGTLVPARHRIPQRGPCHRRGRQNVHHSGARHCIRHAGQRGMGRHLLGHPPAAGRLKQ